MDQFMNMLKEYAEKESNPASAGNPLEALFSVYANGDGPESEIIKESFKALDAAMEGKSVEEMDNVRYPVTCLCREHEKAGFLEGVKVGFRLAKELNNWK